LHRAIARARGWSGEPFDALIDHCVTAAGCSEADACASAPVPRKAAALIATQAFNLDGNNTCADTDPTPDPDPDPDPSPEVPSESSGCVAGGSTSSALVLYALLVLAIVIRPGRQRP
jgi:hypothetical protein